MAKTSKGKSKKVPKGSPIENQMSLFDYLDSLEEYAESVIAAAGTIPNPTEQARTDETAQERAAEQGGQARPAAEGRHEAPDVEGGRAGTSAEAHEADVPVTEEEAARETDEATTATATVTYRYILTRALPRDEKIDAALEVHPNEVPTPDPLVDRMTMGHVITAAPIPSEQASRLGLVYVGRQSQQEEGGTPRPSGPPVLRTEASAAPSDQPEAQAAEGPEPRGDSPVLRTGNAVITRLPAGLPTITDQDFTYPDGDEEQSWTLMDPLPYRGAEISISVRVDEKDGCYKDDITVSLPDGETERLSFWDEYGALPAGSEASVGPAEFMQIVEHGMSHAVRLVEERTPGWDGATAAPRAEAEPTENLVQEATHQLMAGDMDGFKRTRGRIGSLDGRIALEESVTGAVYRKASRIMGTQSRIFLKEDLSDLRDSVQARGLSGLLESLEALRSDRAAVGALRSLPSTEDVMEASRDIEPPAGQETDDGLGIAGPDGREASDMEAGQETTQDVSTVELKEGDVGHGDDPFASDRAEADARENDGTVTDVGSETASVTGQGAPATTLFDTEETSGEPTGTTARLPFFPDETLPDGPLSEMAPIRGLSARLRDGAHRYEDSGEKIGGARKDQWKQRGLGIEDLEGFDSEDRALYVTKKEIWPKDNYRQLIKDGMPLPVVMWRKLMRDAFPEKPVQRYMVSPTDQQDRFVQGLSALSRAVRAVQTLDDLAQVGDLLTDAGMLEVSDSLSMYGRPVHITTDLGRACFADKKGKWSSDVQRIVERARDPRGLELDARRTSGIASDRDLAIKNYSFIDLSQPYVTFDVNNMRFALRGLHSVQYLYLSPDVREDDEELVEMTNGEESWAFVKSGTVMGVGYPNEEAARDAAFRSLNGGAAASVNGKKSKYLLPEYDPKDDVIPKWRATWLKEHSDDVLIGSDDIYEDEYREALGLKWMEFGNWMPNDERRVSVNASFDAFFNIAHALGVKPESLSFDGRLSIGFGSRGNGRALAHYEPGKEVINITRTHGAGSLCHELFHAIDDIVGKKLGLNGFLTENHRKLREVAWSMRRDPSLEEAREVMEAMEAFGVTHPKDLPPVEECGIDRDLVERTSDAMKSKHFASVGRLVEWLELGLTKDDVLDIQKSAEKLVNGMRETRETREEAIERTVDDLARESEEFRQAIIVDLRDRNSPETQAAVTALVEEAIESHGYISSSYTGRSWKHDSTVSPATQALMDQQGRTKGSGLFSLHNIRWINYMHERLGKMDLALEQEAHRNVLTREEEEITSRLAERTLELCADKDEATRGLVTAAIEEVASGQDGTAVNDLVATQQAAGVDTRKILALLDTGPETRTALMEALTGVRDELASMGRAGIASANVESRFLKDARAIQGKYTGYWTSTKELFARAGAAWTRRTLEREGIHDTYACGHAFGGSSCDSSIGVKSYPVGADARRFDENLRGLLSTLTEKGLLEADDGLAPEALQEFVQQRAAEMVGSREDNGKSQDPNEERS